MTPEIGAIKHIGDLVDGRLVCRPDCPSITHKRNQDIQVTPTITQSKGDYEANMKFDEARDEALQDQENVNP